MKFKNANQRKAVMAKLNKKYYLADIKRKVYDDKAGYNKFDMAVRGNIAVQMVYGNDYVVPMKREVLVKEKWKKGRLNVYQPASEDY